MSERLDRIEAMLETMLAVQRDLQNSQINLQATQSRQQDESERLLRIMDRLVGYRISTESDRLDLEERMTALERRVRRLEPPEG
jgi:hypothetical protein